MSPFTASMRFIAAGCSVSASGDPQGIWSRAGCSTRSPSPAASASAASVPMAAPATPISSPTTSTTVECDIDQIEPDLQREAEIRCARRPIIEPRIA